MNAERRVLQGHGSQAAGADVITCPAVAGILLRLLLGCDDSTERVATLESLHELIGMHSAIHAWRSKYQGLESGLSIRGPKP